MRAEVLGLRPGQNLQALADAGGMAIIDHRLKTEQVAGGTAIHVAATGGTIAAEVPVRNAVLDPLSNTYVLDGETPGDKSLRFVADPDPAAHGATAQGTAGDLPGLLALGAPADSIPLGADLRIDDCIVCIPGQSPLYFTFAVRPVGSGVVNGTGQAVTHDWWEAVEKDAGAPVPMAVGERFRGREFTSFASFECALWRAVTEEGLLISQLDEINRKRLANGYAPYARKSDWLGERHEFEIRYARAAVYGTDSYNLDRISIHKPTAAQGLRPVTQPFAPWLSLELQGSLDLVTTQAHSVSGNRTWTPLVPPGREALGPTALPPGPSIPAVLPGTPLAPARPQIEILPGENIEDINANIPGFGAGTELPSPGLVFALEPAKPLETGDYIDIRRRSINDDMDADHIVSRKALELFIDNNYLEIDVRLKKSFLEQAPSIVIPSSVHRRFSETYGGRNTKAKQKKDAADLRAAVDSNMDALKSGLLEYGFTDQEVERTRHQLHELHQAKGWYK
ncbi:MULTISPECIES: S-type pyocin domain-containing protein [Pseudomonas]|uniref:Pyosin/cloacin translocation domain-containing protein n=1 Tax=Pseudomonas fluorescens TaxID=294 RepID=A0A5E6U0Q9_PSEFL|nr:MULTISPECIES: S-type pyocin domain-containing protein [Pseudomonas]VVM94845.1 hypothetical protein PS652_02980 [Pseudomonas fluorescens]